MTEYYSAIKENATKLKNPEDINTKWNTSQRQILYDSIYMWYLK